MRADLLTELNEQKRKVDFDSFDITVKELVSMVVDSYIDIAPEYQRQFRWKDDRQSSLIESVFLGIAIPSLFMAANADGTWELIDGVQRLSTLIHFTGDERARNIIGLNEPLVLSGLEKLPSFNKHSFQELPQSAQMQFQLKPLKVTTISDKSDRSVRFDLFERLNTGGVVLTSQEIRSCVYRGQFNELLRELATRSNFKTVVRLPNERQLDGTQEELVLRFFAYLDRYTEFRHSVKEFLNDYMRDNAHVVNFRDKVTLFDDVFSQLAQALPEGISRATRNTTPLNLYEAVTVGAALAHQEQGFISVDGIQDWIHSEQLRELTTGATNSNPRVKGRIEYCRDKFMEH